MDSTSPNWRPLGESAGPQEAAALDFTVRVAVGDSLLAGDERYGTQGELDFTTGDEADCNPTARLAAHRYAVEDVDEFNGILTRRSYHVVVGNPPTSR